MVMAEIPQKGECHRCDLVMSFKRVTVYELLVLCACLISVEYN